MHLFAESPSEIKAGFLDFKQPHLDLVLEPQQKTADGVFAFTNKGESTFKIVGVKTSCGCTVADIEKKIYAPGESGELKVTYKKSPDVTDGNKTIILVTDEPQNNFYTLSITATHKSAVSIDPYFTKWSINSAPIAKKIHIKILDPYNFHVTDVGTTNENFEASVKTIKAGSEYEVTISPNETTLKSSATIRFYTDSKDIPVVYARALVQ
jgi:hypothetical protein